MGEHIGNKPINESWGSMIQMAHFYEGISEDLRQVLDGQGTATALNLAKNKTKI